MKNLTKIKTRKLIKYKQFKCMQADMHLHVWRVARDTAKSRILIFLINRLSIFFSIQHRTKQSRGGRENLERSWFDRRNFESSSHKNINKNFKKSLYENEI